MLLLLEGASRRVGGQPEVFDLMSNQSQRLIGLTGGIGTGKTTVSRYLAETYHLPILDADVYAREAVKVGSPILDRIFQRYDGRVQLPDGELNRRALAEIIFSNANEKHWLENQIHPHVRECFESEIERLQEPIIVLAIPLLFEAKMMDLVTEIWVVYCTEEEQIKRLTERDRLTQEQVFSRIKNQWPIQQKIAAADVVLDNSSTVEGLEKQIDRALQELSSLNQPPQI